MKCHLIAMGNRMPAWVNAGFKEYADRLPKQFQLLLHEIPLRKRGKNADMQRIIREEGNLMLAAVPRQTTVIALDCAGSQFTTRKFSKELKKFHQNNQDIAVLMGGPEGLAQKCQEYSKHLWSLSALTFPHPLVRVIFAEQIYRAWSLINKHPYHRE